MCTRRRTPLTLLLFLAGCASSPEAPPPREAAAVPSPASFLWEYDGREGKSTIFGTSTLSSPVERGIPPLVWGRLRESGTLLVVADIRQSDEQETALLSLLPPGQDLQAQLSPETWRRLSDHFRGRVSETNLRRLHPWFVVSLLRRALREGTPGEAAILARAEADGKTIESLEDWRIQVMALRASLTAGDIEDVLDRSEEIAAENRARDLAYRTGDRAELTRLAFKDPDPERNARYYEMFFRRRAAAWLPRLKEALDRGGVFVALKAEHLLGPEGVIERLRRDGYALRRVAAPAVPADAD